MKNLFIICLAIIGLALNSYGQAKFGVKGGVNYTNIGFHSESGFLNQRVEELTDAKFGYHVGVFAHFTLTEKVAFKPELLFSTQGQKSTYSFPRVTQLNYLSLPLLLEVNVFKKVGFTAGPHLNYLLTAKDELNGNSFNVRRYYNALDVGFTGGLFFQLSPKLQLTARYQQGLSKTSKDLTLIDDSGGINIDEVKNGNQVVQIGLNVFLITND